MKDVTVARRRTDNEHCFIRLSLLLKGGPCGRGLSYVERLSDNRNDNMTFNAFLGPWKQLGNFMSTKRSPLPLVPPVHMLSCVVLRGVNTEIVWG